MQKTAHLAVLALLLALAPSDILSKPPTDKDLKLVFSQVIFRHGDRNPVLTYPTDPYKDEKYWPEGIGQLTKVGMQQMYGLGEYLRQRYSSILDKKIIPNNLVYVQSTDSDRTLMSAEALLAGLFPPTKEQIWNEKLLWQPVPVHTTPTQFDYVLCPVDKKECKRYDFLKKQHANRTEYIMSKKEYAWLDKLIKEKSGSSGMHMFLFHDTLQIQKSKNKTNIPDWAEKYYNEIAAYANIEAMNSAGSRDMARLTAGFVFREIVQRFNTKIANQLKPNRNLWLYSAHDVTIVRFGNLLNILPVSEHPPYAASLCLELYEHAKQHYIKIIYNKKPLAIPGCEYPCLFNKFQTIYEECIPKGDFQQECAMK